MGCERRGRWSPLSSHPGAQREGRARYHGTVQYSKMLSEVDHLFWTALSFLGGDLDLSGTAVQILSPHRDVSEKCI